MGGRGAFINSDQGNFTFVKGGQLYHTLEKHEDYEVIERTKGNEHESVPYYSHSKNSVYVIVKDGKIESIIKFDEKHNKAITIDFSHEHGINRVSPHIHYGYEHIKYEEGTPPDEDLQNFINRIIEETGLELDYPKNHFKKKRSKRL